MTDSEAETLALQVLDWLAGPGDLLRVFLGTTGMDAATLRSSVDDPAILAAVLEFVMMDDSWIQQFSSDTGVSPSLPARACVHLQGGELPHWT